MIYPRNFEEKVGFDRIREMLHELCLSPMGQSYVEKIRFSSNHELILRLIDQTEEFRQLLLKEGNFPSSDYFDLSPELKRISIEGTYIEQDKLFNLKSSLETIIDCIAFIKKQDHSKFPELITLVAPVNIEPDLTRKIDRIIDSTGEIKDSASTQLGEIRRKLISKRSSIDRRRSTVMILRNRGSSIIRLPYFHPAAKMIMSAIRAPLKITIHAGSNLMT